VVNSSLRILIGGKHPLCHQEQSRACSNRVGKQADGEDRKG